MTGKKFRPFSQACRVKAQRGIRTGLEIVSDRYELHLCHAGQKTFPSITKAPPHEGSGAFAFLISVRLSAGG